MIDLLAPILELQDCSDAVFCPERVALDRNERMAVAGSEVQEPAAIWDNHDETEGQGEREDLLVVPVKAQRCILPGLTGTYPDPDESPFHAITKNGKKHFEIFSAPGVVAAILFKWNAYGRAKFQKDFHIFIPFTFFFTVFALLSPVLMVDCSSGAGESFTRCQEQRSAAVAMMWLAWVINLVSLAFAQPVSVFMSVPC